jgi:hypothetical protein
MSRPTSLLDELTAELGAVSDHLPLPALRRAVVSMRTAGDQLIHAIRLAATAEAATVAPVPGGRDILHRVGRATAHLESGAGLLMRAQDEIGAYLTAIGHRPPALPASANAPATTAGDSWWARRVGVLTGEDAPACPAPAGTAGELMHRVVVAVRTGDRRALHAQLVGAGAALGTSLAGVASAAIGQVTAEWLRRDPEPADVPRLRARVHVGDLLPHLPDRVVTSLVRQACHAPDHDPGGNHDPVDLAVGAAVVAARLAGVLGREQVLVG